MDCETVNATVQALREEINSLRGEMSDLQSDWDELKLWVQNGVDMNEANARNTELTVKQDILTQRLSDLHRQLAAALGHV